MIVYENGKTGLKCGRKTAGYFIIMAMIISGLSLGCGIPQAMRSVSDNLPKFEGHVDDLKQQVTPVDSLTMYATLGLLEGLTNTVGQQQIDSLLTRINLLIRASLQQTVADLAIPQVGKNLIGGMVDTLTSESDRLQDMLHQLSSKIAQDMVQIIEGAMTSLTSLEQQQRISTLLSSVFGQTLADSLAGLVNHTFSAIKYSELGDSVSQNLIASKLSPQIDSLARKAIRSVLDEINVHEAKKSIFADLKNVITLAIGGIGVLIALFTWFNRRKYVRVNEMLLAKIERLSDSDAPKIKKEIYTEAVQQGIIRELDAMLKRVHLLKRSEQMRQT